MIKQEFGNDGVKIACELMGYEMGLGIMRSGGLASMKRLSRKSLLCRKRGGIKWIADMSQCQCRSGREWNKRMRACLYTTLSKECQQEYGKHFSQQKNRCICRKGKSVYNLLKKKCQLKDEMEEEKLR